MSRTVVLVSVVALVACGKDPIESGPSSTPPTTAGPESEYTWYADVRPIVYQKCAQCHNPEGIGTGDFTTHEGIAGLAPAVADALADSRMPPWTADPECRSYHGSDRMSLSDAERALIQDWALGGAPEGDEATAAPAELFDGHLADPDVLMPMPISRTLPEEYGANDYFCTIPENPFVGAEYIDAIDVQLGDPSVVHHMCLFADLGGNAGTGYGVDEAVAQSEGFECGDPIIEYDWLPIHCWAPGMDVVEFDPGMAMMALDSLQFVIQMHYYNPDGASHTDQSSYAFRTVSGAERIVEMLISGPDDIAIPAGDPAWSATDGDWADQDYEVLGAFPHMHLLGTEYRAWIEPSGGGEQCLVAGPYDFDHQATYMFEEPALWEGGTKLNMSCTWDNTAENPNQMNTPPETVYWGEGTDEEMCYLLYYVSAL